MRKLLCALAAGTMLFASAGVAGAAPEGQPSLGALHGQSYYYLMTQTLNMDLKAKLDEAHSLIVTGTDNRYAIAILDEVIKLDPNISEAYLLRGMGKTNMDEYNEADKDYESALMLEPENPCFYYLRGMNRYYQSAAMLEKAVKEKTGFWHVEDPLKAAKRMFDKALEIAPHYLDAQVGLADAFAMEGDWYAARHSTQDYVMKRYEKALSIYNHVLVLVPRHDIVRSRKEDIEERISAYQAEQAKKRMEEETRRRINETRQRIN